MMILDDQTDLLDVLEACVGGYLDSVTVGVREGFAVTVIAVSEGYPGSYFKGRPISMGQVKGIMGMGWDANWNGHDCKPH